MTVARPAANLRPVVHATEAMNVPSEADVLRGYRRRAFRFASAGVGLIIVAGLIVRATGGEGISEIPIGMSIAFGGLMVATGLMTLANRTRITRRIRRYGLHQYRLDYTRVPSAGNGQPMVRLRSDNGSDIILTVNALVWRWSRLERASGSAVWFAGDGRRGGVLVLSDLIAQPYWLRRIKFPPFRRSMERKAFGNK